MLGAAVIWLVMGVLGAPAPPPVSTGPFHGEMTLLTDVTQGRYGPWALASLGDTIVLAEVGPSAGRGDHLVVRGTSTGSPGVIGGRPYSGILRVGEVESHQPSTFLPHVLGRAIRERVVTRLERGCRR